MSREGLSNLWQIGRSNKREAEIELRARRKQIGKFGIGKLATYAIAQRVTYVTRQDKELLSVTLDFSLFTRTPEGSGDPVELDIRSVPDWSALRTQTALVEACRRSDLSLDHLLREGDVSWTFSILEDLKAKALGIQSGRLRRVLSTAMPLKSGFKLILNGEPISSSKEEYEAAVEFSLAQLPPSRLSALKKKTGIDWTAGDKEILSPSFPSGISGKVVVSRKSLVGKSDDMGRSHGFFIRVRGRLVNEEDPLFGLPPLSHSTLNRFRADVEADDLDEVLTAPREGVRVSDLRERMQALLGEVFNEAREKYEESLRREDLKAGRKPEHQRTDVSPQLVERPVADILATTKRGETEADEGWFYLEVPEEANLQPLVAGLYAKSRARYAYKYTSMGKTGRLVRFEPASATFLLNEDHEFVRAHSDDPRARMLLEDVATAEAMLEVYLREHDVHPHAIGEVLERRDHLLRSLAKEHVYSLEAIETLLRDSSGAQYDLEVALVIAMRALGFVAQHIGGSGKADGVARFSDYQAGERKITLEAKSNEDGQPSLQQLDFAGLAQHVQDEQADGCLLIASSYPGESRGEDSAVSRRATDNAVSCWTIDQVARIVAAAESRHITAQQVLDIVLRRFTPAEVTRAVDELLSNPEWDTRRLYQAVIEALKSLKDRLPDVVRTVDLVAGEVSRLPEFRGIKHADVTASIRELAHASRGALTLSDSRILVHHSIEEIERRVAALTGDPGEPRKPGGFRQGS